MKNKGFTLIELLVVISIIGLLSSIVFASLNSARAKARDARRISDLDQLRLAQDMYYDSFGQYPDVTAGGQDCWGAWQAGNTVNGSSVQFLQPLVTNNFISVTPHESSGIKDAWGSQCTYRYMRITNPCTCSGTYAVLYTALETNSTQQAQSDERPSCFLGCWGEGAAGYDYAIYLKE